MRRKLFALLFLAIFVNLILVSAVQSTTQIRSKGVVPVQSLKDYLEESSSASQSKGAIATGVVSEPTAKGYAIIIGISDYDGTSNDLNYCDDDAQDFNNVLLTRYNWKSSQISLLIDDEATRTAIVDEIETVTKKAKENDEVIFFYSGHGYRSNYNVDSDGEKRDECIIPWEGTPDSFIWDGQLNDMFEDCSSERILFYFDCCYSGGMTDLEGEGRLICMASKENQLSLEGSRHETRENGQFTYYFVVEGMSEGNADVNDDDQVTFEEAFDYAKANCQRQQPTAIDNFTDDMLP